MTCFEQGADIYEKYLRAYNSPQKINIDLLSTLLTPVFKSN